MTPDEAESSLKEHFSKRHQRKRRYSRMFKAVPWAGAVQRSWIASPLTVNTEANTANSSLLLKQLRLTSLTDRCEQPQASCRPAEYLIKCICTLITNMSVEYVNEKHKSLFTSDVTCSLHSSYCDDYRAHARRGPSFWQGWDAWKAFLRCVEPPTRRRFKILHRTQRSRDHE